MYKKFQLHKTEQVERWCQWYLQVNFNEVIEKHAKTFEALHPDTQATLLNKRWPPEWFVYSHHRLDDSLINCKVKKCVTEDACSELFVE
jgi:hypothetical protein